VNQAARPSAQLDCTVGDIHVRTGTLEVCVVRQVCESFQPHSVIGYYVLGSPMAMSAACICW
jgi:hypothetical protein